MYALYKTARRLPPLPNRDQIPDEEAPDFERALETVRKYSEDNAVAQARNQVDGQPYAKGYWSALANTPRLMTALRAGADAIMASQSKPGSYSAADHELIDLVLGFDSGYWGLHAGHTPNAITSGVRIEALEALRDGREDDLAADEQLQVAFIRAVRDGTMTDDLWSQMVERLGSVRGVIEFAFFVCYLFVHHRMMWALGVPAIELDDWNEMIEDFKSGRRSPADGTQDYVWPTLAADGTRSSG